MPGRRRSTLVFEADLQLDPILDDLAVLDRGRRLHDLDRLDVADRLRCGRDGLPSGIAPRAGARADHLADDDDAHGDLLGGTAATRLGGPSLVRESTRPALPAGLGIAVR